MEGGKVANPQLLAQDIQGVEAKVGEERNKHCVRTPLDGGGTWGR